MNLERGDTKEKLKFLHSVLAPFFEAYFVTAHHIGEVIEAEIPGEIMYLLLHFQIGIMHCIHIDFRTDFICLP